MRTVAIIVALASVLVAFPVTQADDCAPPQPNTGAVHFCISQEVNRPSSLPTQVNGLPYWGKYYIWIGPGHCLSPLSNECTGQQPASPGSGVPLPAGSPVGPHVFGVLWQESNGIHGLQRRDTYPGPKPADHMVLI